MYIMGFDYEFTITYISKVTNEQKKYKIGSNSEDTALGIFFQDNTDICYDDIIEIKEQ